MVGLAICFRIVISHPNACLSGRVLRGQLQALVGEAISGGDCHQAQDLAPDSSHCSAGDQSSLPGGQSIPATVGRTRDKLSRRLCPPTRSSAAELCDVCSKGLFSAAMGPDQSLWKRHLRVPDPPANVDRPGHFANIGKECPAHWVYALHRRYLLSENAWLSSGTPSAAAACSRPDVLLLIPSSPHPSSSSLLFIRAPSTID